MSETFRIELANCEQQLLEEIANPQMKREDVAQTYGLTLMSSECERVDFAKVNAAISQRWSRSALKWIKDRAWNLRAKSEGRGA
jgi:hypothetical protein